MTNCINPMLAAVPSSEVHLEDCVKALKRFNDRHFDLAIVDPPYGAGDTIFDTSKVVNNKTTKHNVFDWNNERPNKEYWEQLFRVSKNQIVWGGNYFTDFLPPSRCWVFWDKKYKGMHSFADGEFAYTSFDKNALMYSYRKPEDKLHPCQKPVTIYDWLLINFAKEGDLILDTHLGSGSSRIAAYKGGFNFVGFEINAEYYEKQEKRFNDFKSQLRMF